MANFDLTPIGKLFFASLVSWIVGDENTKLNWNLRGEPKKLEVMTKTIIAAKKLQQELKRPGATVDTVFVKLNEKIAAAQEFQATFGFPFPL